MHIKHLVVELGFNYASSYTCIEKKYEFINCIGPKEQMKSLKENDCFPYIYVLFVHTIVK